VRLMQWRGFAQSGEARFSDVGSGKAGMERCGVHS
jgi:hypothetical protein